MGRACLQRVHLLATDRQALQRCLLAPGRQTLQHCFSSVMARRCCPAALELIRRCCSTPPLCPQTLGEVLDAILEDVSGTFVDLIHLGHPKRVATVEEQNCMDVWAAEDQRLGNTYKFGSQRLRSNSSSGVQSQTAPQRKRLVSALPVF